MASDDAKTSQDKTPSPWWIFVVVSVLVFVAWVKYPELVWAFYGPGSWETFGQIGDTFGGLNALFSGLAFAALVVAVILQTKELALQRQEVRRTADAQERTARALLRQTELQAITVALAAATARLQFYGRNTTGASLALQDIEAHEQALSKLRASKGDYVD